MPSGRSITRLSTRPCWPTASTSTVGPMSISSSRTSGSSDAVGGTANPAYWVMRLRSWTEPLRTSSRSTMTSAKYPAIARRCASRSLPPGGSEST